MKKNNILDLEEFFNTVEAVADQLHLMATSELISEPIESNAMLLAGNNLFNAIEKYKPIYEQMIKSGEIEMA